MQSFNRHYSQPICRIAKKHVSNSFYHYLITNFRVAAFNPLNCRVCTPPERLVESIFVLSNFVNQVK